MKHCRNHQCNIDENPDGNIQFSVPQILGWLPLNQDKIDIGAQIRQQNIHDKGANNSGNHTLSGFRIPGKNPVQTIVHQTVSGTINKGVHHGNEDGEKEDFRRMFAGKKHETQDSDDDSDI